MHTDAVQHEGEVVDSKFLGSAAPHSMRGQLQRPWEGFLELGIRSLQREEEHHQDVSVYQIQ